MAAVKRSLRQWVEYIQTLHHRQIDLTLERVRSVYQRLAPGGVRFKVISVAGTNGKGSTAEILASIYRAAGYRVGKYTSPHLVEFNERINIQGQPIGDAALLAAFERVEKLRADTPITFFEYGTLVAVERFIHAAVDVAVMEVGLGGRMDAVNILDANVAVVTNVSIDHTAWLGDSVEAIAVEKAGIARPGRPCVVGMHQPPNSLIEACQSAGAILDICGRQFDYHYMQAEQCWAFTSHSDCSGPLPLPFGQAGVQLSNAAAALQALRKMQSELPVTPDQIQRGLMAAELAGRCQVLQKAPMVILDVAHNEASLSRLATFLQNHPVTGKTVAVCGMLKDKQIATSLKQISAQIDGWHLVTINTDRGSSAQQMEKILLDDVISVSHSQPSIHCHDRAWTAYQSVLATLTADDCLVVFGSFFIAGDILRQHQKMPGKEFQQQHV